MLQVPVVGEDGQEVGRGQEAGREVAAREADQLGEPRGHRGPELLRDQAEGQRPHVRRLGLHGEGSVRADELPPPGVERARRDVAVPAPLLLGQPEHLGHPDQGRRRAVQVGRCHLGLVRPRERAEVGRRPARLQPLTPVEAGVPQVPLVRGGLRPCRGPVRVPAARGRGRREPDPGGHGAPRLAQQRGVPVRLVEVPGGADHDVTPSGRAVERAEAARRSPRRAGTARCWRRTRRRAGRATRRPATCG